MVIAAVTQKQSPLALGNVIGSIISNILAAFSLGLLFLRGHVEFDRSSKIYVTLLLVLAPPITVLGYFGKGGVVFGSILIVVFGLYVVLIGIAIFRGVLAAPELEDSLDEESNSDSARNSNGSGNGNSRRPAPGRPDGHDESSSNEASFPTTDISSPSPQSRALS